MYAVPRAGRIDHQQQQSVCCCTPRRRTLCNQTVGQHGVCNELDCASARSCRSKADTEAKNLDGKTALEVATLNSQDGVVELFKSAAEEAPAAEAKSEAAKES